jgi:hypothetical protein
MVNFEAFTLNTASTSSGDAEKRKPPLRTTQGRASQQVLALLTHARNEQRHYNPIRISETADPNGQSRAVVNWF